MPDVFLTPADVANLTGVLLSPRHKRDAVMDGILPKIEAITETRVRYARGDLSQASGVYFLFDDVRLLYIGKAASLSARVFRHYMNALDRKTIVIPFDHVAAIEIIPPINGDVESYYIQRLRPPYNVKLHA